MATRKPTHLEVSPLLLSLKDKVHAAAYIGVSTSTLDRYVREGRIRPTRVGGRVMFAPSDLDLFILGGGVRD